VMFVGDRRTIKAGFCKSCKWRNKIGECDNIEKIHETDWKRRSKCFDQLVYSYEECGTFWVGKYFGCVHWEKK